jgi:hypothetical protein
VVTKACERGGYSPRWAAKPENNNNFEDEFLKLYFNLILGYEYINLITLFSTTYSEFAS